MAELRIDGNQLVLHLSAAEKLEGVHGDLRAPLSPSSATGAVVAGLRETAQGPGADRYLAPEIEAAVYGYLLEKRPWGSGEYAVIFLGGNEARVAALTRKFPHHVPPLKPASRAQISSNQTPMDKDTGKPGLILTAKAVDPTNDVSEAIGTWNGGGDASGLSAFVLMKVDGEWTIKSVQ